MTPAIEPTSPETLGHLVRSHIEPWMEVLFVGLSPDLLGSGGAPEKLVTIRQGSNVPTGPWDVVFLRTEDSEDHAVPEGFGVALKDLRRGGLIGLVATAGPSSPDAAHLIEAFRARGCHGQLQTAQDGAVVVTWRSMEPGAHDLVGLRRILRKLGDHPGRVASVLERVMDADASECPSDDEWSIKELVTHLGDLDRFAITPTLAHILDPTREAPRPFDPNETLASHGHAARLIDELVTRYQHIRFQSIEVFSRLTEADYLKVGPDLSGSETTVSDLLRGWAREEEALIETIVGRLSRTP